MSNTVQIKYYTCALYLQSLTKSQVTYYTVAITQSCTDFGKHSYVHILQTKETGSALYSQRLQGGSN